MLNDYITTSMSDNIPPFILCYYIGIYLHKFTLVSNIFRENSIFVIYYNNWFNVPKNSLINIQTKE